MNVWALIVGIMPPGTTRPAVLTAGAILRLGVENEVGSEFVAVMLIGTGGIERLCAEILELSGNVALGVLVSPDGI